MSRHNDYDDMMTAEDRALAKKESQSFHIFIGGFLMTTVYAAIAFFDVWKMRDALPMLLIQLFPGVEGGNPTRLYTAISILIGGLAYFITIMLLWHQLAKPGIGAKKRILTLIIWCAGAAVVYVLLNALTGLVI